MLFDWLAPDEYEELFLYLDDFFFLSNDYLCVIAWPMIVIVVGFLAARLFNRDILFNKYFLCVKIGTMLFFYNNYWVNAELTNEITTHDIITYIASMVVIRQLSLIFLAKQKSAWMADLICVFFEVVGYAFVSGQLIAAVGHNSYSVSSILYYPYGLTFLGPIGRIFVNVWPYPVLLSILAVYGFGWMYMRRLSGLTDWNDRRFMLLKCALVIVYTLMNHDRDLRFVFEYFPWRTVRWTFFLAAVIVVRQLYIRFKLRRPELAAPDFVSALSEPILIAFALRMFEVYVSYGGKTTCCF